MIHIRVLDLRVLEKGSHHIWFRNEIHNWIALRKTLIKSIHFYHFVHQKSTETQNGSNKGKNHRAKSHKALSIRTYIYCIIQNLFEMYDYYPYNRQMKQLCVVFCSNFGFWLSFAVKLFFFFRKKDDVKNATRIWFLYTRSHLMTSKRNLKMMMEDWTAWANKMKNRFTLELWFRIHTPFSLIALRARHPGN